MEKIKGQNESIDSEDFQQWMIAVDDDETEIEQLHKEYLEEKRSNEQKFNTWLEQFIKESGHQWGFGFYIETMDGRVIYQGTDEYKDWYDDKLEEYKPETKETGKGGYFG